MLTFFARSGFVLSHRNNADSKYCRQQPDQTLIEYATLSKKCHTVTDFRSLKFLSCSRPFFSSLLEQSGPEHLRPAPLQPEGQPDCRDLSGGAGRLPADRSISHAGRQLQQRPAHGLGQEQHCAPAPSAAPVRKWTGGAQAWSGRRSAAFSSGH